MRAAHPGGIRNLPGLVDGLRRHGAAAGANVSVTAADFDSSIARSTALLEGVHVLIGAHGAGLTNSLFATPGGSLRGVLQLMGDCFGVASFSYHAYEVLGRLTTGHAETLCCRCVQPERHKESDLDCDVLAVARRVLAIAARASNT